MNMVRWSRQYSGRDMTAVTESLPKSVLLYHTMEGPKRLPCIVQTKQKHTYTTARRVSMLLLYEDCWFTAVQSTSIYEWRKKYCLELPILGTSTSTGNSLDIPAIGRRRKADTPTTTYIHMYEVHCTYIMIIIHLHKVLVAVSCEYRCCCTRYCCLLSLYRCVRECSRMMIHGTWIRRTSQPF